MSTVDINRPDTLFSVTSHLSNVALAAEPARYEHAVTRSMAEQLAHLVVNKRMRRIQQEHSTMFVMDVVVMSPEEFHRAVMDEAGRLVAMYPALVRDALAAREKEQAQAAEEQ